MQSADFAFIRDLIRRESAIVLDDDKEYLAESRLQQLARVSGLASVGEVVAALRTRPYGELHRRAVDLFTITETSFFRDARVFDALRARILPAILAAPRSGPLTIWCAASSSGQEPYSIAMMLREHFPEVAGTAQILATDLSRAMLARVDAGVYSAFEIGRGLPANLLARYFVAHGADWQVAPALRAMVRPMELNLSAPWPALPAADLVLIRNVLIYFDQATRRGILARARALLRPHGVIILGATESLMPGDAELERQSALGAVYYRAKAG